LFTLDQLLQSENGINHVNLVDFIKDNKELWLQQKNILSGVIKCFLLSTIFIV
jgi:hypothetical protein